MRKGEKRERRKYMRKDMKREQEKESWDGDDEKVEGGRGKGRKQ